VHAQKADRPAEDQEGWLGTAYTALFRDDLGVKKARPFDFGDGHAQVRDASE